MTEHSLKRCLIAGRFQPFHLGHLELVKQAKINFKEIIIVIGSSQFNHLFKDPFTSGER
ncbi:MAG: nicotinamide-nucleotide adenylyltransferase, partial [Nitrososphaeraceae archaeon]|nr:nicotinamide-nucleotide adenylyltransferase [Nitrososphaeraceae archaeon]